MKRLLLLLAACHERPPPAEPPPPPPPPIDAPAAARCNELDVCTSQCDAGDDLGCRRLALLGTYALGPAARAQIFPTLDRSCSAGHLSSCVWTPYCDATGGKVQSCDPQWLAQMAQLCERQAAACVQLTAIYAQLGDEAAELAWRGRAIAKTETECTAGDPSSCYASWYGFQFYRPQHDAARAGELLAKHLPLLQHGCDDGDAIQCVMVAQMWNQNEPGHEAAQDAATARACKLAPVTLCPK